MQAAIVSIGTELTRGELVNGNAAWLADRMTALGIEVVEHAAIADDSRRIGATLARFGREVKLIVCTGGLGPTSDDLTTPAVAELLGVAIDRHAPTVERLHERYRRAGRGGEVPPLVLKMADVPRSARVLENDEGAAHGFAVAIGGATAYFFPGVPREMAHLFERHLVAEITPQVERRSHQIHLRSFGLAESQVAQRLADIDLGGAVHRPGIVIGYRAHYPEIEIKILAQADDEAGATRLALDVAEQARARLAPYVYGGRSDSYPAYVGGLLRERGLKVAVAESCSGGLISKMLTDVPGSSEYFGFGAVTYANSAKRDLLGVDPALLARHGAVSAEVAAAMAEGVLAKSGADLAVATTGVAGPGGGSEDKPVGTVWFALARRGGVTQTERRHWPGDRERVRTITAYTALHLVAQGLAELV